MVVALGPGKFYGSSLPRPRIYTDVKLSEERVDPPVSVMDPLMSWAQEAHWSMGGLSFKRQRLQGRIEGNVEKLRAERERFFKKAQKEKPTKGFNGTSKIPLPPGAPVAVKMKRKLVGLIDEDESEEEIEEERKIKRTARKLGDDFDKVANEKMGNPVKSGGSGGVAARTRSRRSVEEERGGESENKMKSVGKSLKKKSIGETNVVEASKGTRTSPRLTKRG